MSSVLPLGKLVVGSVMRQYNLDMDQIQNVHIKNSSSCELLKHFE